MDHLGAANAVDRDITRSGAAIEIWPRARITHTTSSILTVILAYVQLTIRLQLSILRARSVLLPRLRILQSCKSQPTNICLDTDIECCLIKVLAAARRARAPASLCPTELCECEEGPLEEVWKTYGGRILLGSAAAILALVLGAGFLVLRKLIPNDSAGVLPLLAIGGIILLMLMLTFVAMIFSMLGLTNNQQAMGLPEGSIRAVIALSLIVLFAILSVFLFHNVSTSGTVNSIVRLSDADRLQFIKDHPNARDLQTIVTKDDAGKPVVAKDTNGLDLKNADGSPKYLYDVSYRSTNSASEDFAKQLLVLLGTRMTAVTSFYLGAGTVTSAVKAGETSTTSASTFTNVTPATHSIATNGPTLHLEITGTNLDGISRVRLVKPGDPAIDGTTVVPGSTKLSCDFDVSTAPPGTWSIEVS